MSLFYEKPSGQWKNQEFYGSFGIKKNLPTEWSFHKKKFRAKKTAPIRPKKPYTFIIRRGANMYYDYL